MDEDHALARLQQGFEALLQTGRRVRIEAADGRRPAASSEAPAAQVVIEIDIELAARFRVHQIFGGRIFDMAPGDVIAQAVQHLRQLLALIGMTARDEKYADRAGAVLRTVAGLPRRGRIGIGTALHGLLRRRRAAPAPRPAACGLAAR